VVRFAAGPTRRRRRLRHGRHCGHLATAEDRRKCRIHIGHLPLMCVVRVKRAATILFLCDSYTKVVSRASAVQNCRLTTYRCPRVTTNSRCTASRSVDLTISLSLLALADEATNETAGFRCGAWRNSGRLRGGRGSIRGKIAAPGAIPRLSSRRRSDGLVGSSDTAVVNGRSIQRWTRSTTQANNEGSRARWQRRSRGHSASRRGVDAVMARACRFYCFPPFAKGAILSITR
jgi:hypothetical protein